MNGSPFARKPKPSPLPPPITATPDGVLAEPSRVGHFLKRQAKLRDGGVRSPEPFRAPEVRQAGIDAHARSGGNQKRVGSFNGFRCLRDLVVEVHQPLPQHFLYFIPLPQGQESFRPILAVPRIGCGNTWRAGAGGGSASNGRPKYSNTAFVRS